MSAGLRGVRGEKEAAAVVVVADEAGGVALSLGERVCRRAFAAALAASRSASVTGTCMPSEGKESDLRRVL